MNRDAINTQINILVQIVRCIQMKKVLAEIDPSPRLNFWRIIHGGLMDLPVLEWYKIFGANAEPTHWKGVVDDPEHFRTSLLEKLNISYQNWEKYWAHMKDYRDEFIAHFASGSDVSNYPRLDIALRSTCYYHDYLYVKINEGRIEQSPFLEEYAEKFYEQTKNIATTAYNATKDIKETVN